MAGWPGNYNESVVKYAGGHIGRIILEVKIYEESEFERIHGEGKGTKEKDHGQFSLFIIVDNLPSLLLVRSLVDSPGQLLATGNHCFYSWIHCPSHWPGVWGFEKPSL